MPNSHSGWDAFALHCDAISAKSRIAHCHLHAHSPDLLALLLACARDGLVFCPVNVALRHNDLACTLGDIARPSSRFFDGELTEVAVLAAAEAKINRAVVIGDMTSGAADETYPLPMTGWQIRLVPEPILRSLRANPSASSTAACPLDSRTVRSRRRSGQYYLDAASSPGLPPGS